MSGILGNLFSSTAERTGKAQNITLGKEKLDIKMTDPKTQKCRVFIDCENMKKLISQIKTKDEENSKDYNIFVNSQLENIKGFGSKINPDNFSNFFTDVKKMQEDLSKVKAKRDSENKKDAKIAGDITSRVYVGIDVGGTPAKITGFNIKDKTVKIEFKYQKTEKDKEKLETLTVPIEKLCIDGEKPCTLTGGGTLNNSPTLTQGKNFIDICE